MPVQDFDSIDDVIIGDNDRCYLVIDDKLSWEEEYDHISAIQNKLKSYIYYIESQQLKVNFPDANYDTIIVSLRGKYPVPDHYFDLLSNQITLILSNAGMEFEWIL